MANRTATIMSFILLEALHDPEKIKEYIVNYIPVEKQSEYIIALGFMVISEAMMFDSDTPSVERVVHLRTPFWSLPGMSYREYCIKMHNMSSADFPTFMNTYAQQLLSAEMAMRRPDRIMNWIEAKNSAYKEQAHDVILRSTANIVRDMLAGNTEDALLGGQRLWASLAEFDLRVENFAKDVHNADVPEEFIKIVEGETCE